MPRRGRHRTTLPVRLIAAIAALLVTGGIVVAAGSAAADSDGSGSGLIGALSGDSGSDSGSDANSDSGNDQNGDNHGDSGDGQNGDGQTAEGQNGQNADGQNGSGQSDDPGDRGDNADNRNADGESDQGQGNNQDQGQDKKKDDDPFPGRDKAGAAGDDKYVDINDVEANGNRGDGGEFTDAGVYTVNCGVSDHNNSDNYMAAPGKQNGAQHVHDYVGNKDTNADSTDDSLDAAGTSCGNGDKSTFFWPVLRNLNGTSPDEGQDGGSLDGNEGSILKPASVSLAYHGHGDQPVEPLPNHLMMITGNAKAGTAGGENANSKYTCTGFTDRVTDQYPVCPAGSQLVRFLDLPSCWDGQNLESEDLRSHVSFPDEQGNCGGQTPIPALRITLTYNQPAGNSFAIDSFPDQQHDPITDHADFENLSSEDQAQAGANCINERRTCADLP